MIRKGIVVRGLSGMMSVTRNEEDAPLRTG